VNLQRLSKNTEAIYNLLSIRDTFPSAIIAGGWLRDLYHDVPINDIDIYVTSVGAENPNYSVYSKDFWCKQFQLKNSGFDNITELTEKGNYGDKNHIEMVWDINKGATTYNIIAVDMDPIKYVEQCFDVGLCKAYCDGSRIRLTADFMHDSQHHEITLVSKEINESEFRHVMSRHIPKIKNKYPGHTLVIPEIYQKWYKNFAANNYIGLI